jgi:probable HAF family extracellular repeat protein
MSRLNFRHHDEERRDSVALQLNPAPMTTITKVGAGVVNKLATLAVRPSSLRLAGLSALVWALAAAASSQTITIKSITPVALPPGATNFSPLAINAAGDMAGIVNYPNPPYVNSTIFHAAIYSHGIVTDLGAQLRAAFNCPRSNSNSCEYNWATAINDSGQVAGWAPFAGGLGHAFLYDQGVVHDLGTLPGGSGSYAYGMNAAGDVVGEAYISNNVAPHAFLYSGGTMQDLGTLGGWNSRAVAINDAGDVVGYADISQQASNGFCDPYMCHHAFLYSKGVMQDLGALPGGISYSGATAINASGQITGSATLATGPEAGHPHAFLYANGVMTDIGPSNAYSYGNSINSSGQIVGHVQPMQCCSYPFLYTPASGILDLNSLLPPNSGWTLSGALAINDIGQGAAWAGYKSQPYEAVLLTIDMGTSPVTMATISGPTGTNGWYIAGVSVTLSATGKGSSIAATYFSVDGAAYQVCSGPFPITGDGTHQLSYYSVDTAGSQEKAVQQTIRIDATKPVSHVAALPAAAPAPGFNVTWSGVDPTSGIANYTIFVADNGGAFAPWISGATATQATYAGVAGHTYGFYSIATDVAGNQELAKASAEATTTVPKRPVSHVAPLPANAPAANFTVQWSGSAPGVGIRDYTIYASDNGGAFAPWLSATANTQGTYPGVCEHNYGFYSIATDNRGIQEVAKTTAEATTRVPFSPVSHVLALPGIAPSSNFNVQWAGVNTCTPIQTWDIYVSDNGGAFARWKARTSSTQAYFSGVLGHTYGFYSIAFDSGGSAEAPKSSADAMTQTPAVMAADVNSDGRIDCADVSVVKAAMGTRSGQPGFNARADLNSDGVVDVRDLAIVTQKLAPGASCP